MGDILLAFTHASGIASQHFFCDGLQWLDLQEVKSVSVRTCLFSVFLSHMGIPGVVSDLSLHIAPAPSRASVELARHSLCMGGALKAEPPQINAVPWKQGWTPSVSWTKNKNLSSGKSITRVG